MNAVWKTSMRIIIVSTVATIGCLSLFGCESSSQHDSWVADRDDSLGILAAGENERAIMGSAWLPTDGGSIQLQFAAGSIPEPHVKNIELHDGELRVTMANSNGPTTMDFHLHQFTLTPPQEASADAVDRVVVSVNGNDAPAQRAETVVEP